jgi:hypothetical protein
MDAAGVVQHKVIKEELKATFARCGVSYPDEVLGYAQLAFVHPTASETGENMDVLGKLGNAHLKSALATIFEQLCPNQFNVGTITRSLEAATANKTLESMLGD